MNPKPPKIDMPKGVNLRDFGDHTAAREALYKGVEDAVKSSFPMSYGGVRMEVDDLGYEKRDRWTTDEQKKALLADKYLARRLRGRVKLVDEETGKVLEERKMSLMRVPHLTGRGTFIHGGNEYTSIMQSRLLPGVYTRRQENGVLETQFNTRRSRSGFRVGFEPDTAQYRLRIGQANLHMYSLMKDLGIPDKALAKKWGDEILMANQSKYDPRVFEKAYARLVPPPLQDKDASREEKAQAIKDALEASEVNASVLRRNLPNAVFRKTASEWEARWAGRQLAMEKLAGEDAFLPDLDTMQALYATMDAAMFKAAGETWDDIDNAGPDPTFDPDLKPGDLKKEYANLYGHAGDRLAGMKKWPDKWMPPGSDQLGWLNWYFGYSDGKRTDDDDRQIKRWKSFKARHLVQFLNNPTPRRAAALRMWAIDPLSYLDGESSDLMSKRLRSYYDEKLEKAAAVASHSREDVDTLSTLVNAKEHSDAGRMGDKAFLVQRSMMERPEEWVVDSPGGPHPGVTHVPTGFRLHIPASRVPPQVQVDENYALQQQAQSENETETAEKVAAFDDQELQAVAQYLNREHGAGIPLNGSAPEKEQAILDFIGGEGVDAGMLGLATQGAEEARKEIERMSQPKAASFGEMFAKEAAELERRRASVRSKQASEVEVEPDTTRFITQAELRMWGKAWTTRATTRTRPSAWSGTRTTRSTRPGNKCWRA